MAWVPPRVALAALVGLSLGVACSVTFPEDIRYACTSDADCAGGGFACATPPGGAGACCRLSGREVCDGTDNDCNGLVDDGFPVEICNGIDDDCDGETDEGFDLQTDRTNCGQCGNACTATQVCTGACVNSNEGNCQDGIDNDGNGLTDCDDPTCAGLQCGIGCRCQAGARAELNCVDGVDNDGDSKIDCGDENCGGAGCGDGGCTCGDLQKKETDCTDSLDNDDDTQTDCADSDCLGKICRAGSAETCAAGGACNCNGGAPVAEMGARCRDGLDNDCDGLTDCADATCDGLACGLDGGAGCLCAAGKRTETLCADRVDNDADGFTDCTDADDCALGTACTFLNGQGAVTPGTCQANRQCAP